MENNKIIAKKYISVNEASNLFNKSISTIRKLVELNKILFKKENNRLLIDLESIKRLYSTENNQDTVINNNNDEKHTGIEKHNQNDLVEVLKDEIKNLKTDKLKLYEDIEARRLEQSQMQKLFENQQTLMLGLQQQLKTLTETKSQNQSSFQTNNDHLNWDQNDQNVTEIKAKEKKKKWWFF